MAPVLIAIGSRTDSAQQDKYTLQVPNGLKFSDFRGYEDWQVVAVSQTDDLLKVMVANPTMIDAYRAGVPGNASLSLKDPRSQRSSGNQKRTRRPPFQSGYRRAYKISFSSRRIASDSRTRADGLMPYLTTVPRLTNSRPTRPVLSIAAMPATRL